MAVNMHPPATNAGNCHGGVDASHIDFILDISRRSILLEGLKANSKP